VHALVFSRIDAKPPLAGTLNSVSLLATKLDQVIYARLYDVEDWGVEVTPKDTPSIGDTPVSL
jgi:hypothetical protein